MKTKMSPARLLLVDDQPRNLVALEAILQRSEYEILTASSGEEAMKRVLREPVTLILLDVVMPGMSGFEVARHLKELGRTREIPILFLTAIATDAEQIYRAYEAGAADYLVKPLDPEVVRRKVAVFVDLVRQREQIRAQEAALREADRREYELRLAELRVAGDRRYRKLVEGIDHAVGWTADASLRLTFISRQATRILGYPVDSYLEPDFWRRRIHPDDVEMVLGLFERAVREASELVCNHRMIAADGGTVWLHTGVSGDAASSGAPAELHGISVDVSDIKRAQEEAQRATHVREELLAIVAHDLRNPLNSIQMSAALLERVAGTEEDQLHRTARTISRSARRMERLISDLLDFALIQAERVTIEREVLDAREVVQEGLETFRALCEEKGVRLAAEGGDPVLVRADRDRLLQVLSNLVGNAIKFTPENGAIRVQVRPSGEYALFEVSDTGRGMSADEASHVWERYWQARRREGGVGLGLSIAKGFVEAHGGRIWLESAPGQGSTFFFTIPLASAAARSDEEHPPEIH